MSEDVPPTPLVPEGVYPRPIQVDMKTMIDPIKKQRGGNGEVNIRILHWPTEKAYFRDKPY
ncbi:MAG: hypothetical protein GF390_01085, partial [Candidatus Pacebacteria bacterium]|nr:hypothetical protein [Candidatus Paceibacterota bacterium]